MRNKGTWMLLELLIMLLVFSLAAAVCLQIFSQAAALSRQSRQLEEATVLAQNAAELLKSTLGDTGSLNRLETGAFRLRVLPLSGGTPGLGRAQVTVLLEEKELLTLTASWQEVAP